MNCPCCKITNCLVEFQRHPSITSFRALGNVVKIFAEDSVEQNAAAIKQCEQHRDRDRLDWFDNILKDAQKVLEGGFVWKHLRSAVIR